LTVDAFASCLIDHTHPMRSIVVSEDYEAFKAVMADQCPDGFTMRDEANAIVAYAFRNGPLENLHAGESSELLDNPRLSRITDEEMKVLMLNACEAVETLLREKEADPKRYKLKLMQYNWLYCRKWQR